MMKKVFPALMAFNVSANTLANEPRLKTCAECLEESIRSWGAALVAKEDLYQERVQNLIEEHQVVVDDLTTQLREYRRQSYAYESSNQECRSVNAELDE